MKNNFKALFWVGCLALMLLLGACSDPAAEVTTSDEVPRQVMVEGELYADSGKPSDITGRCGVMDGEITSSVEADAIPTVDNQSNFGTGYGYQFAGEGCIDVLIDDVWQRFELEQ